MLDFYTENLADFGYRERKLAGKILSLPLPETFYDDGVKLAFNRNSGYVFLVNSEYQCAMINPETGNLEIFHSSPFYCVEGFLSDLILESPDTYHLEDVEYIKESANNEGLELPENWKV